VGEGITFVDGHGVGYTITRVHDDTSGTTGSVERQDGLDGNVHGGGVEGLEHDLSHLFAVSLGVKRGLSQEDGVLFGGNAELVVESVMPDLFHVIPVGNDTVFDGVLQGQDTTLGLGFIADIGILLSHTDHDTSVTRTTNDRGEYGARGIVASETGLTHTGPIVNDERSNFLLHVEKSGLIRTGVERRREGLPSRDRHTNKEGRRVEMC